MARTPTRWLINGEVAILCYDQVSPPDFDVVFARPARFYDFFVTGNGVIEEEPRVSDVTAVAVEKHKIYLVDKEGRQYCMDLQKRSVQEVAGADNPTVEFQDIKTVFLSSPKWYKPRVSLRTIAIGSLLAIVTAICITLAFRRFWKKRLQKR